MTSVFWNLKGVDEKLTSACQCQPDIDISLHTNEAESAESTLHTNGGQSTENIMFIRELVEEP